MLTVMSAIAGRQAAPLGSLTDQYAMTITTQSPHDRPICYERLKERFVVVKRSPPVVFISLVFCVLLALLSLTHFF